MLEVFHVTKWRENDRDGFDRINYQKIETTFPVIKEEFGAIARKDVPYEAAATCAQVRRLQSHRLIPRPSAEELW